MAFTNPWDPTSPLDTQNANLLGDNLRDLKVDIQQRMGGFGAGTLAARPTPDTASGADFTGVTYFATDTQQAFRWSGSAWVDISSDFPSGGRQFADTTLVIVTDPGVPTNGQQVVLPATVLSVGDVVNIRAAMTVSLGTAEFELLTGTTSLAVIPASGTGNAYIDIDYVVTGGSAETVRGYQIAPNGAVVVIGVQSVDPIANAITFTTRVNTTGSLSVSFRVIALQVLRPSL